MNHKLLLRQLKSLGLAVDRPPDNAEDWNELLNKIARAYADADNERYLTERSLEISSNEMKSRWQTVQRLEEQWRSLGECVPDLILMVDRTGSITFANRGRGALSKDDLVGTLVDSLYLAEDRTNALSAFTEVIMSNRSARLSVGGIGPSNEQRSYTQRLNPIVKDGVVSGAVVVESDVTEQVKLAAAIEAERATAMHASKFATLGEMAGGIAHEINTPLTTIMFLAGAVKGMAEGELAPGPDVHRAATKIELTIERISKIIHGLKAFARQSDGDPFATTLVKEVIDGAVELCRNHMRNAGVELIMKPFDPTLSVDCRSSQLVQIILNLCGNSADALEHCDVKQIEIEVVDFPDDIEILVTDSGPGIPLEIQNKIMQPFFTTKQVGKGTGLGLSISRGIADQHGGSLTLKSNSPRTCFVLRLPKHQGAKSAKSCA